MDIITLIGLVLAAVGLLGGMYFKGVPFTALANPAALFIILIGTVAAVANAFPKEDIKNVPKLFAVIFLNKRKIDNVATVRRFSEYAQLVRRDGLLALEPRLSDIKDPFEQKALGLLLTGQNSEFIKETLEEEIFCLENRHKANALIFTQAGTYAPTLGVLGAVIGLIAALGNLNDIDALGHAISAAFIATVYGIFTGYVLWHPFANKLKRKSAYEVLNRHIIEEGVLLLEQGLMPDMLIENLTSFLAPKELAAYRRIGGSA